MRSHTRGFYTSVFVISFLLCSAHTPSSPTTLPPGRHCCAPAPLQLRATILRLLVLATTLLRYRLLRVASSARPPPVSSRSHRTAAACCARPRSPSRRRPVSSHNHRARRPPLTPTRRGDTATTGASSSTDGRLGSQILLTVMNPLSPTAS